MRESPEEPVSEMYGPNQDVSVYRRANLSELLSNDSRTATWAHLIEDLRHVVRKVEPAVIVMPHPLLDSHPDHQLAAVAMVEASSGRGTARYSSSTRTTLPRTDIRSDPRGR